MRSRFGVGTTPPNVLETPKPVSSVMINRTFGAPLGGTTRAGQYGVDCAALRSILPSNFCGGGGSWLPSIVFFALGEPGVPVVCCALVVTTGNTRSAQPRSHPGRAARTVCFMSLSNARLHIIETPLNAGRSPRLHAMRGILLNAYNSIASPDWCESAQAPKT